MLTNNYCHIIPVTRIFYLQKNQLSPYWLCQTLCCKSFLPKCMWILKYNWQNVMLEQRLKKKTHSAIKLKIVFCSAVHSVYIISCTGHSTTSTFTLLLHVNGFHRKLSHHSLRHWWQSPCCLALAPHVSFNQSLNISSSFFKTKNCPKTT